MFFLSKLLPLFVYPVGLSVLLMGLGLLWLWRYPKRATWAIASALFILFISSNSTVSNKLVSTLEQQYLPPVPMPTAGAIVILGGATEPALAPRPWVEIREQGDRILYGARLYNQNRAPKLILSGGRVTWRGGAATTQGEPSEADDMKEFAMAMNVPESAILLEGKSLNTRQNAVNVKEILDQNAISSVLLVTSAMHMPRAIAIFKKLGIHAIPAPTDYLVTTQSSANLTWQGHILALIPDAEALSRCTRALKEYVGFIIYRLQGWA
ncbi:MAG: YdcF family protein [Phormidesmis sp. RL_2_1]|nr:YdcF family protein [Phormidesmis sp. RL_2_1]